MHNTERIMMNEQLSQQFDLADELRRRIDELAEIGELSCSGSGAAAEPQGNCERVLKRA